MKNLPTYLKVSVIIAICCYISYLVLNFDAKNFTWQEELRNFGIQFLFAFPITLAIGEYNIFLNKFFSWEKQPNKRLQFGIIGTIIIAMIIIAIVRFVINVYIFDFPIENYWANEKFKYYLVSLLITIFITVLFHAYYFFKELQKQKITEQKIIAGTASAQFSALKNQLDPHFLFNSLNVLTSLIEEDQDLAQKFTTSLSKVYRYVLEQKNKELVSVEEELKFAKTYMTLLKLRFEDSIVFNISGNIPNLEAKIVPLSLQILLENTVKHNVVTPQKPLKINIYEKDNFLIVENNLQPKEVVKKSTGVGLSNVKQRYALLTKRAFSVHKTNNAFVAELPMLNKQTQNSIKMEKISNTENLKYLNAKEHVEELKKFYNNLFSYCIVITGLAALNYYQNQWDEAWFFWPAFGWGIGIVFHAIKAFRINPVFNKDWEERKIRKYMEEEENTKNLWE